MKTISESSIISPTIMILSLLAATVAWIAIKGVQMPVLSNLKVSVVLLIVLGMAICSQGGIGRVADAGQWTHPLAIVGYLLGASILLLATAIVFNVRLPFLSSPQQGVIIMVVLIGAKFLNSALHYFLGRGG